MGPTQQLGSLHFQFAALLACIHPLAVKQTWEIRACFFRSCRQHPEAEVVPKGRPTLKTLLLHCLKEKVSDDVQGSIGNNSMHPIVHVTAHRLQKRSEHRRTQQGLFRKREPCRLLPLCKHFRCFGKKSLFHPLPACHYFRITCKLQLRFPCILGSRGVLALLIFIRA